MTAAKSTARRSVAVIGILAWMMLATALCQSGKLTGTIKDANGKAIPGARAVLSIQDSGMELRSATTDASGRFEMTGMPYGSYKLGASAAGYLNAEPKLIILTGASRTVDLTLAVQQGAGKQGSATTTADPGNKPPLAFTPAGVRGTIAPSGYSTGLSSEETAQVNHNVRELGADALTSLLPAGTATECSEEPALRRAVDANPHEYKANQELGLFYLRHRDYERSAKYLLEAKKLAPGDEASVCDLATALLGANRPAEAVTLLEPSAAKHSSDAAFMRLLALAYERAGDTDKARAAYLLVAKLDTGIEAEFESGMGLIRVGALEDARRVLAEASSAHAESAQLWMALGVADDLLEHKAAAVQELLRAIEKDQDYEPSYRFLANLAASVAGTEAEIRRRLAEFVVRRPESMGAHLDYALAMWKQHGQDSSAASDAEIIAQLKIVITNEPGRTRAHFVLGDVYADSGELAKAEQEFRTVVEQEPKNAQAHYRLAQVYRKEGRTESAASEIEAFRSLHGKPIEDDASAQNLHGLSFINEQGISPGAICPPLGK